MAWLWACCTLSALALARAVGDGTHLQQWWKTTIEHGAFVALLPALLAIIAVCVLCLSTRQVLEARLHGMAKHGWWKAVAAKVSAALRTWWIAGPCSLILTGMLLSGRQPCLEATSATATPTNGSLPPYMVDAALQASWCLAGCMTYVAASAHLFAQQKAVNRVIGYSTLAVCIGGWRVAAQLQLAGLSFAHALSSSLLQLPLHTLSIGAFLLTSVMACRAALRVPRTTTSTTAWTCALVLQACTAAGAIMLGDAVAHAGVCSLAHLRRSQGDSALVYMWPLAVAVSGPTAFLIVVTRTLQTAKSAAAAAGGLATALSRFAAEATSTPSGGSTTSPLATFLGRVYLLHNLCAAQPDGDSKAAAANAPAGTEQRRVCGATVPLHACCQAATAVPCPPQLAMRVHWPATTTHATSGQAPAPAKASSTGTLSDLAVRLCVRVPSGSAGGVAAVRDAAAEAKVQAFPDTGSIITARIRAKAGVDPFELGGVVGRLKTMFRVGVEASNVKPQPQLKVTMAQGGEGEGPSVLVSVLMLHGVGAMVGLGSDDTDDADESNAVDGDASSGGGWHGTLHAEAAVSLADLLDCNSLTQGMPSGSVQATLQVLIWS